MRMLALLLSCLALPAWAETHRVEGRVFEDRNANGQLDADEAGIAGAKLSNGRELALSDAEGRYRLALREGDTLFLIKPPGFALPRRADGMPDFWRHHVPNGSPPLRYGGIAASDARQRPDFALLPQASHGDGLQVLLFGDPQPKSRTNVDYYARDIVDPIVGRHAARFGLSLGDIVDDDLSLYPAMNAVTARLGLPWLHLPGNHDLDFDAGSDADSLLSYRAVYGPDSFAWEEPEASFIALDNVVYQPGQRPDYIGGLREEQFAFLAAYLETLPAERPLVLAAHIPFFNTRADAETFRRADRERLFALLARFTRVLLLSAHSHRQQHVMHGPDSGWQGTRPLHEYNVGAACGGFWGGVKDAEGIPSALMADGTPNGYALLSVAPEGDYRLHWFAARAPEDYQIALHAPQVLRRGAYPATALYANVFLGMDDTVVEFRIGDGPWRPMQRAMRADPRVLRENALDDLSEALRGFDRTPEASPSAHLWRAALPTDLDPGEHRITVRADVPWRGWVEAEAHYRLVEVGE
jgi:hypothetical protein